MKQNTVRNADKASAPIKGLASMGFVLNLQRSGYSKANAVCNDRGRHTVEYTITTQKL